MDLTPIQIAKNVYLLTNQIDDLTKQLNDLQSQLDKMNLKQDSVDSYVSLYLKVQTILQGG